jgi:hypothetical protein
MGCTGVWGDVDAGGVLVLPYSGVEVNALFVAEGLNYPTSQ